MEPLLLAATNNISKVLTAMGTQEFAKDVKEHVLDVHNHFWQAICLHHWR